MKIITNLLVIAVLFVSGIPLIASVANAAATDTNLPSSGSTDTNIPAGSGGGLQNPLKVSSFPEFLNAILGGIVEIGAIFLTVMIVYVGFLFVAARGNEEKIRDARNALVWVVIGGLILLGAQAISLVIQSTVTSITA